MTPADLQAIEARAEAARTMPMGRRIEAVYASADDIPALVAEVRRLQEIVRVQTRAMVAVEWTVPPFADYGNECPVCERDKPMHEAWCDLNAGLTASGLPDQAARDAARGNR